jgi:hypothetical protein
MSVPIVFIKVKFFLEEKESFLIGSQVPWGAEPNIIIYLITIYGITNRIFKLLRIDYAIF